MEKKQIYTGLITADEVVMLGKISHHRPDGAER